MFGKFTGWKSGQNLWKITVKEFSSSKFDLKIEIAISKKLNFFTGILG